MAAKVDLKKVLTDMKEKLVRDHGFFLPPTRGYPSVAEVMNFVSFMNAQEPARKLLAEAGLEWPVEVKPKSSRRSGREL